MEKKLTVDKHYFLAKWRRFNLIGWIVGLFCVALLYLFLIPIIEQPLDGDLIYQIEPILTQIAIVLPLGISVGTMQWLILRQWEIKAKNWILATGFGGIIPAILVSLFFHYQWELRYSFWGFILYFIGVALIGASIGVTQIIATGKAISQPSLWISTNALGLLVTGLITEGIIFIAFTFKSVFLNFFYAHDLYTLVSARDFLLLGFILLVLPFIAGFTIAVPTGKLLLKYFVNNQS